MGSMRAIEMANQVTLGNVSLETALQDHLVCNHFPPYPWDVVPVLIDVCKKAIKLAEQDKWDETIQIPKIGSLTGNVLPVGVLIEALYLQPFVTQFEGMAVDEW